MKLAALPLLAFVALLFVPDEAHAWGPLAHLHFSQSVLESTSLLPAATRILLAKCAGEFLYGSLAADIIVGKNLARYAVHCHNWKVGFAVLARARGESQQAFALGFLAHLAADTVAHNYYVPYKTVAGFEVRSTGHAYWELRFDQKLDSRLWQLARRVTRPEFRRHDRFLEDALAGSAVIPFGVSKQMFNQLLLAARMKQYQAMSAVVASRRALSLDDEEVRELSGLVTAQILGLLSDRETCRAAGADPTGGRNLHFAVALRQQLREARRRDALDPEGAARVLALSRPAFRNAIHGKLVLPELPVGFGHATDDDAGEVEPREDAAPTARPASAA